MDNRLYGYMHKRAAIEDLKNTLKGYLQQAGEYAEEHPEVAGAVAGGLPGAVYGLTTGGLGKGLGYGGLGAGIGALGGYTYGQNQELEQARSKEEALKEHLKKNINMRDQASSRASDLEENLDQTENQLQRARSKYLQSEYDPNRMGNVSGVVNADNRQKIEDLKKKLSQVTEQRDMAEQAAQTGRKMVRSKNTPEDVTGDTTLEQVGLGARDTASDVVGTGSDWLKVLEDKIKGVGQKGVEGDRADMIEEIKNALSNRFSNLTEEQEQQLRNELERLRELNE